MNVDITAIACETSIPEQTLAAYLAEQPVPLVLEELVEGVANAKTLVEMNRIILNLPPGSELKESADKKRGALLSKAINKAKTILDWYEVYRYTPNHKTRVKARKKIEMIFTVEFETADSVEKLTGLFEKLPKRSKSLSTLRRQIILELATYFEVL